MRFKAIAGTALGALCLALPALASARGMDDKPPAPGEQISVPDLEPSNEPVRQLTTVSTDDPDVVAMADAMETTPEDALTRLDAQQELSAYVDTIRTSDPHYIDFAFTPTLPEVGPCGLIGQRPKASSCA